ncbi:MAG: M23 family metallopeptidase [Daejeonella sp.]|uniref:M23 family metallopeptidase n=1 Tax=unclassified Daejeonella TaxID=2805396 RepID=UPI0023EBA900|nr:M23 family metallopeptidase [Daejeonella sp. JGW-45]
MNWNAGGKGVINCITFLLLLSPVKITAQDIHRPGVPGVNISLPLAHLIVTSSFGWRIQPILGKPDFHRAVDLAARNDPVYSIMDGIVCETGKHPILGNYVRIGHGNIQSIYGHLSHSLVKTDQTILAGQPIGITGSTGRATGEHLHFSIVFGDKYIHPLLFLKGAMEQQVSSPPFTKN